MNEIFKKYLIRLHVFSLILGIVIFFVNPLIEESYRYPFFWAALIVFHLISIFIFRYLHQANAASPQKFIRAFMATSFIKLFSIIIALAIGGFLYRKGAVGFIMHVMVLYLAYLVFDVVLLMGSINKKQ